MSQAEQSQDVRTRMFARAFGPFLLLVSSVLAVRASSQIPVLIHTLVNEPMWQWVLGALLVLWGSVVIAFHQYWRSPAAVVVSLFGWFLTIEGVLILTVPHVYTAAGNIAIPLVRAIFGVLALVGLYLTYVGWVAKPSQDLPYAAGR